jgi:hypothetical protein
LSLTDLRTESILNPTVWKLRLICFAFLVVDLVALGVILLFHDFSGCKLRRIMKNLQQAKKPISYISIESMYTILEKVYERFEVQRNRLNQVIEEEVVPLLSR